MVWLASGTAEARALDHLLDTSDIGSHKMPNQGVSHILVIPVHVGPEGFDAGQYAELQERFAEDGSFRQYWLDVSGGRYDPIPTVVAPVEYPDSCPLPNRTVATCTVSFQDTDLLSGGFEAALTDVLGRIRDEQGVDLSKFDVNTADGAGSDGYFDGVIAFSNIAEGVAPPLIPLFNETIVKTAPGGGGSDLSLSLIAMAPPAHHEFAHMFGFIDLYGGPPLNGLMNDSSLTISAFSRQQVGWADITTIDETVELSLPPVLADGSGNPIVRVNLPNDPARYLLIENRSGTLHDLYDGFTPGIQIYSVDEQTLTEGPLHFLDIVNSTLNLPNETAPYMNINLPAFCNTYSTGTPTSCSVTQIGEERVLTHANGTWSGWTLRVVGVADDGTMTIQIYDANGPPVKNEPEGEVTGGCAIAAPKPTPSPWLAAMAGLAILRRRRSR